MIEDLHTHTPLLARSFRNGPEPVHHFESVQKRWILSIYTRRWLRLSLSIRLYGQSLREGGRYIPIKTTMRCVTTVSSLSFVVSSKNNCAVNPCENGGTCVPIEPNTFQCVCPPGFTGGLCEARDGNDPSFHSRHMQNH